MTRLLLIIFLMFPLARAQWSEPVRKSENGSVYRQVGDFRILANEHAIRDDSEDRQNWPTITDWGEEIYVTDTTISQYIDPRLAISDSMFHVFSPGNGGTHPHHYVSYDDGDNWDFFADYSDTSFNVPPGIINVFAQDNLIYTVWQGRRGNENAFIYFRASSDFGSTWPIAAELVQRPWHWRDARFGNIGGNGDTVFVSFEEDSVTCWTSTDMGQSWSSPGYIASREGSGYPPSIVYEAGIVSIAYNQAYENQLDVFYIRSTDHGTTWSEPTFLGFNDGDHGQWPEVAADSFGNVAVSWMDYLGSPYSWTGGIWVRISHDSGQTWDYPVRMETDYRGDVATHVVVDGSYVGVAWKSVRTDENNGLHYRESWDGGTSWSEDLLLSPGPSYVPRLAKRANIVYLTWSKYERIPPNNDWWSFIKFMRNDGLTDTDPYQPAVPVKYSITSCPNPFNSAVVLTLANFEGGDIEIKIYDVLGNLARTLLAKEGKATWDATDNSGRKVSSGIYFARVEGHPSKATKLVYLR